MLQGMGMGGGMMDGGGMMGPGGNMGPPGNNMVSTATHSSFFKIIFLDPNSYYRLVCLLSTVVLLQRVSFTSAVGELSWSF